MLHKQYTTAIIVSSYWTW